MLKDVINVLKDISLRHRGVKTFRYQGDKFNNAQNNYEAFQVYVDDISLHELNITTGVFKVKLEIYVLGQPDGSSGKTVLDIQNDAYTIACNIMAKIDGDSAYHGILSVYDYSLLTLARYTDDNSAGVKLSLTLEMPNPVNLCTLDDNFNEYPYSGDTDTEITISGNTISEDLTIVPIKLPRKNQC